MNEAIDQILALVARVRGVDFRDYHAVTVRDRLLQRAGGRELTAWLGQLERDPVEVERLAASLLVPVTSFFREAHALRAAADLAVRNAQGRKLRAWVVGAASGEEAYSLGMLLAERRAEYEIVASDIEERWLAIARAARYPGAAAGEVPAHLREKYVVRFDDGTIGVADAIRERVRFSRHDLIGRTLAPAEAVVASFELVLCRNVLIYFAEPLRTRAVSRLGAALAPGGVLLVGAAEWIDHPALEPQGNNLYRRAR